MLAALALACAAAPPAPQEPGAAGAEASESVLRELASHGVRLDPERGLIELDGQVAQLYAALEFLLVARPRGKDYESLLSAEGVSAEALNTALLLLGLEPGRNGRLVAVDPPPTPEELEQGASGYTVEPARGPGVYIYVSWEEEVGAGGDARREAFFYRAEDLVLNTRGERAYQRGRWVYLGSRFVRPHKDAPEMFAAEAEGNLVSLCYFDPANHLLTGADPEADNQYVWYPNYFLLPELGHPVRILLSREILEAPPPRVRVPGGGPPPAPGGAE